MGFSATLAEWFEIGNEPGTFQIEVNVNEVGLTSRTLDELNRLINDAKPVSRHISQMSIATHVTGFIYTGAALYGGDIISIYPEEYEPDDSLFYNGMVFHDGNNSYR